MTVTPKPNHNYEPFRARSRTPAVQLVPSVRKHAIDSTSRGNTQQIARHATDAKRGKTRKQCQAWRNKQRVPSAGKHATNAKHGETCNRCHSGKKRNWCQTRKTCNRCQTRRNMQSVPRAEKHVTGTKHGKTCHQQLKQSTETRENMQPVPSAGKHATIAKRGKICNRYHARENMQCNRCQAREDVQLVPDTEKCLKATSQFCSSICLNDER